MSSLHLRCAAVAICFSTSVGAAFAASNTVSAGRIGRTTKTITAEALKPSDCSTITVNAIVVGSGTVTGTAADELILGGAAADAITGGAGDDCIVGGGGIDTIAGGLGTDVCVGGAGIDVFLTCETQIQ